MISIKPLSLVGFSAFVFASCAPARTTPEPVSPATPAPTPSQPAPAQPAPTPAPVPAPALPVVREAPRNWQLLDVSTDGVPGIAAIRAERELLAGRAPKRTVIVAVIDGGIDTSHADLRTNLWKNPREVGGNGRDDDGNGYVDDVRGWNFIGGRDGRTVEQDTYEVTRLYVLCTPGSASTGRSVRPAPTPERCGEIKEDFEREKAEAEQTLEQVRMISTAMDRALPILRRAAGTDSLTTERVTAIKPTNAAVEQAKRIYLQLQANGIEPEDVQEAVEQYESRVQYGLNPSFDPRGIVGDQYGNLAERRYGNSDVMGPDAMHGTHVAGIIGAVRGNGEGVDGVAPAVRLMMVRTVPDGDERDKDVANAIRYAVDNGAHVINMSFGKSYSPQKSAVDEAVKYADSRGVLLVHAAGNDGEDVDQEPSFPTPVYQAGGKAANWIEVGASSWRGADSLVAPFSNYGRKQVDVFAPGADILSTVPGGGYERESGTSMAAPVVSGLAALLMAHYPNLTAADVKRIILGSATRYPDRQVLVPGSETGARASFGSLSATGGIVNAHAAVRMAEELSAARP
ncbi:MAG: S8 family peptidase [Gemmatimonadaceae bacterium]